MKKCIGCGICLQTTISNKPGFTNKLENDYCLRCFRIKNYNDLIDQELDQETFIANIKNIVHNDKDPIFYYILDIFDLEGTRMLEIENLIANKTVVIVINKIDLIPKSVKLSKIRKYVTKMFASSKLANAKIILTASDNQKLILPFLNIVLKSFQNQYFIGASNVGKSSLINALMKANNLVPKILESRYFNTTLELIDINLDSGVKIIDTPGIARNNSIAHIMNQKDWQYCYFKKELRQYTFQLNSEQAMFFSGLAWFTFISETKIRQNFHIYVNKEILLHRTKQNNAANYFTKNKELLITPTVIDEGQEYHFKFEKSDIGKEFDISISGLGWINFIVQSEQEITFIIPLKNQKTLISLREPII
ncbi:ribosome biogenesis GTPase YqeH [Mesoplasma syrphidae]|uniref:Ribosome biogenesis GTPase YqeH n=1 Tax=Mesoplasma syrphidae TaxID=225999 RepID=A0A2K9BRE5_9MOLU|nr:ribosome biogenesis GTPase YqeH [Mesoplasma syrphidae]AUF83572.1 ribosome biogenesis GTPase YqeH [Mesoplasma syrphidae]